MNNKVVNRNRSSLPAMKSEAEIMLILFRDGFMLEVFDELNILHNQQSDQG